MSEKYVTGDDHAMAQPMAQLAHYAYHLKLVDHEIDALQFKLHQMAFTLDLNSSNPFYDQPSGHHGYITTNAMHTVIAIRGSGELEDWRNNLRYWQEPYRFGGHVHAGFALAARGISQVIQAELRRAPELYDGRSLWLTGHSSGGAVAILVGQELAAQNFAVDGIFTFGAPKVGDSEFACSYPLRRLVHAYVALGDLIPLLPWPWLRWQSHRVHLQRYQHVIEPQLLIGKTVSLKAAIAQFHHNRSSFVKKIFGALMGLGPHSLPAAYIPNLGQRRYKTDVLQKCQLQLHEEGH